MAITAVADVTYESWGGYDDPRLPARIWRGKLAVTGDNTGGTISAFLRFNLAGAQRLDSYYSLEELYQRTNGLTESPRFESRNFGAFKIGVRFATFRAILNNTDGSGAAPNPTENRGILPLFLGQQIFTGTAMELVMIFDNVDTILYDLWMGGYVWGPRSASAKDGGLLRPPSGIFSV